MWIAKYCFEREWLKNKGNWIFYTDVSQEVTDFVPVFVYLFVFI